LFLAVAKVRDRSGEVSTVYHRYTRHNKQQRKRRKNTEINTVEVAQRKSPQLPGEEELIY